MRPMLLMGDHSTRLLRLAEALDLPKTSEDLSARGADPSVHLTVLPEALRGVVSPEAILLLSLEPAIALEAPAVEATPAVSPEPVTPADVTDNNQTPLTKRRIMGPPFLYLLRKTTMRICCAL